MEKWLIYYNPLHDKFYTKITCNYLTSEKRVGYVNQFGHILCQILYYDLETKKIRNYVPQYDRKFKKTSLKDRLINDVIHLLYKLKK